MNMFQTEAAFFEQYLAFPTQVVWSNEAKVKLNGTYWEYENLHITEERHVYLP